MENKNFPIIKSIIASCICEIVVMCDSKIKPDLLNELANKYTDEIINETTLKE